MVDNNRFDRDKRLALCNLLEEASAYFGELHKAFVRGQALKELDGKEFDDAVKQSNEERERYQSACQLLRTRLDEKAAVKKFLQLG